MLKSSAAKSGRLILIMSLLLGFIALGIFSGGCSSKQEKTEAELEESALPEDLGEKTLLDTTTRVETPPIKEEAAQKPQQEKPKPKPKPKEEVQETKPPVETKPAEPQIVKTLLLKENSGLEVSLLSELKTDINKVGDKFRALIKGPAEGNQPLGLPDGSMLEGEIAEISDGKGEGEKSFIKLKFTSLMLPGEKPIPLEGWVITNDGAGVIRPGDQGTSIAKDAAVGAAAGGIIGAITGGKTKDAAKGAVIGGVAGGVAGAILHKDQVTLKEGRTLKVNIVTPVYQEKTAKGI
jgi:hypothetical protein